jgi:hypothetical protein
LNLIRRLVIGAMVALLLAASIGASSVAHAGMPSETVRARKHFFGAENVDDRGNVRRDRVILSWFSVASFAMAIDGTVVLLDTYIHKGEDQPNYVPTTKTELVALRPKVIFVGHGHFDHSNTAGEIAARTHALVVGTPEHCDQTKAQADAYVGRSTSVRCLAVVKRGSTPGAEVHEIRPLGKRIGITVLKHLHSAYEHPDGEGHESILLPPGLPDPSLVLFHPPGPGFVEGAAPQGDEGWSLMYRFRIGGFSLIWNDTSGPLREEAPQLFKVMKRLPPTDVQVGAVLGFNGPTNGMRDPVDYVDALRPRVFYPNHHDFVAEYGASKSMEGVFRREMARRPGLRTEVRWLYDPYDYLRPQLLTFDIRQFA